MIYLILIPVFELLKRIITTPLYPIVFLFREWAREKNSFLAYVLDDTIVADNIAEGYPPYEYCGYGKRDKLVEKLPEGKFKELMRSFAWGAVRNNSINLMVELEKKVGTLVEVKSRHQYNAKSFYEIRLFTSGLELPYLEYWIGKYRLQIGFLSCGRPQVQFRNLCSTYLFS